LRWQVGVEIEVGIGGRGSTEGRSTGDRRGWGVDIQAWVGRSDRKGGVGVVEVGVGWTGNRRVHIRRLLLLLILRWGPVRRSRW
jgi:hypothetical protein